MGSEEVFEVVVRAGKIGDLVAGEEMRPVTPSHLEEVPERRAEPAGRSGGPSHAGREGSQPAAQKGRRRSRMVFEQGGHPPYPPKSLAYRLPQGRRPHQAAVDDVGYAPEARAEPPFLETRRRLLEIKLSLWWSLSPEASRGGRPSSVRALRTAAQEPRTTSA